MAWLTEVSKVDGRLALQAAAALRVSRWDVAISLVMVALGLVLAVQWRGEPAPSPVVPGIGRDVSLATVERLEGQQKALKGEIGRLQKELKSYQDYSASRKDTLAGLATEIERQQVVAGLVPLGGAGVRVVLDDSTYNPAPAEDASNYIIHDYELRDVVNFLWQAGAEAMSINGERVVGTTSVYCVGSTIMVNATRLSPPYEIQVIGNGQAIDELFNQPGTLRKLKASAAKYGVQLKLQRARDTQIPAYTGGYAVKHAAVSGDRR